MLTRVGLIGDPVAHSVSPAMHNAAFAAYGMTDVYELWYTPTDQLSQRVGSLRAPAFRGANVTLPHKTRVIPLLDTLDDSAQMIGAVNTIVRQPDGELHGLNTDAPGFISALRHGGYEPRGGVGVVLGAGGAARAVVYGLAQHGIRRLTIANRTLAHADALAQHVQIPIQVLALDDPALDTALSQADLLVNATAVGLDGRSSPLAAARVSSHLMVVDLIYHTTPLLHAAAQGGARVQHGQEMLVRQGALAFEAWTGRAAPVDVMRIAVQHALDGQ